MSRSSTAAPATSPTQLEKGERFRALHQGPRTFLIPNPWDAGSARLLTRAGFEALATTSAGHAFSLGLRDGEVTRDEALANARAIVEATHLPVSADLENGYGSAPEAAAETIRLAAATGLVGGSIEDATGDPGRPIFERALAVERVAAAVAAARALPFPFVLVARAENFLHGRPDLDDTIARLQAYAEAGADALYAPGLPSLEAIAAVCAAVAPKPVNVLASPRFTVAEIAAAGARRISVGSALSRAALTAAVEAAREMLDHGTFGFVDRATPFAELTAAMADR